MGARALCVDDALRYAFRSKWGSFSSRWTSCIRTGPGLPAVKEFWSSLTGRPNRALREVQIGEKLSAAKGGV